MNRRFFALFALLFVALVVVAAPVHVEQILEARVAKKVAVAKPVAKPVVKAAKPVAKPVAAPVAASEDPEDMGAFCPIPARKPAVRRFLEYIGVVARFDPVATCTGVGSRSTPATSTPISVDDKAAKKAAAKAAKDAEKAVKAAKAKEKADRLAAEKAAAEAAKRPLTGTLSNAPSKAVRCNDITGGQTKIPLDAIAEAVKLARQGPLVGGKNPVKFPHIFNNREKVNVAAACAGKTLEEQAVGPDMSTFQNIPSVLGDFNQFRVVITTPDASGATTFCGVMTHGTSTTGTFEKDLCTEV